MKLVSADTRAIAHHDEQIRQVFESAALRASNRINDSIRRMNDSPAHPCVDKRAYIHKYRAQAVASRHSRKYGKKMRLYQCPRCRFFHLARIKVAANTGAIKS